MSQNTKINYHELVVENFSFEERLDWLRKYIHQKIDGIEHAITHSFDQWLIERNSWTIKGTMAHAKRFSTHCYYCKKEFKNNGPYRKTIDHVQPKSGKDPTTKFVICCNACNVSKGNKPIAEFVRRATIASMFGNQFIGLQGKSLKKLVEQSNIIFNDLINNSGPRIYFLNLHNNKQKQHERVIKQASRCAHIYSKSTT